MRISYPTMMRLLPTCNLSISCQRGPMRFKFKRIIYTKLASGPSFLELKNLNSTPQHLSKSPTQSLMKIWQEATSSQQYWWSQTSTRALSLYLTYWLTL